MRKASTKARGGHTPFTLEHEIRRLCKKAESSGASSKSSSFNRSFSYSGSLASNPLNLWGELMETFSSSSTEKPHFGLCKQNQTGCHTRTGSATATHPWRQRHSPSCCDSVALPGSCSIFCHRELALDPVHHLSNVSAGMYVAVRCILENGQKPSPSTLFSMEIIAKLNTLLDSVQPDIWCQQ